MLHGKLGLAPKREDKRTLKLAAYLDFSKLPPVPDAYSWTGRDRVTQWGMMCNDKYGCCFWSSCGHKIMNWTGANGAVVIPTDADILQGYSSTGFNPATGAGDNGTVMLDGLKYMQKTGIAGHLFGPFVEVDAMNWALVTAAMYFFGAISLGTQLPLCLQGEQSWDMPPADNNAADRTAGSWGGHAIPGMDYDAQGIDVITWGQKLRVTKNYFQGSDANGSPYMPEVYAIVSPDFVSGAKAAPNGFALQDLLSDLRSVQAS